jgi:hypothetical protein
VTGKNRRILSDRPTPTVGCSASGRRRITVKFSNLFLCSLDHSVLVIAERHRIIAMFTNIEFLTMVLKKNVEISWTDESKVKYSITQSQGGKKYIKIKRNAKWIGHMLLRNGLPKQVIEGNTKG